MVVNPKKIAAKFVRQDEKTVARLEVEIDEFLKQNYQGSHIVLMPIDEEVNSKVVEQIREKYRKAGWKDVQAIRLYNSPGCEERAYIAFDDGSGPSISDCVRWWY